LELKKTFDKVDVNPIDFDQTGFHLNGEVKLQFFNEVGLVLPSFKTISVEGNLKIAPIEMISVMKVKTMFQRSVFRDYYDLYVILKKVM
jgi:predicted nucleotidyltransferase component of viral defense system